MKKILTFITPFLMLGGNASTEEKILKCLSGMLKWKSI
jgi:hypothetical protein